MYANHKRRIRKIILFPYQQGNMREAKYKPCLSISNSQQIKIKEKKKTKKKIKQIGNSLNKKGPPKEVQTKQNKMKQLIITFNKTKWKHALSKLKFTETKYLEN